MNETEVCGSSFDHLAHGYHHEKVGGENEMTENHQCAAERPRLQIRQRNRHRGHERLLGVDHRQALQPASNGEGNEIDREARDDEPKMQRYHPRIRPLPSQYAWHHEVNAAEHHHREESIETQVRVRDRKVSEVGNRVDGTQSFYRSLQRSERIHHGAKDDETKGGRVTQGAEMTENG